MVQPESPAAITRKTISFPTALHDELAEQARIERRQFSPHVIKLLEGIFLPQTAMRLQKKPVSPSRAK